MIQYYCLLLCVFCTCCNSEKSKTKSIKKEYKFEIGKNPDRYHERIYYDKQKKENCIYFSDAVTDKTIKVFDMNGNLLQNISLSPALNAIGKIRSIQMVSLDTIIINSSQTNKIAVINRQGEVWRKIHLDTLLTDKKGNHFELWTMITISPNGETLISPCEWRYNVRDVSENKEPKNDLDISRYFHKNNFVSPYFCKISNLYSKKPIIEYGLYNFYGNIGTSENIFAGLPRYAYVNNKLFVFSIYSDILFEIEPTTMKIKQKTKINSAHTSVGAKHLLKNDDITLGNIEDVVNLILRTEGYVYDIEYDAINEQYYVIVFHKISINTPKEKQGNNARPFSLVIYDKAFKKLDEHTFDNKDHSCSLLGSKEGVMFQRKQNNNKKNESAILTIFDFNK